MVHALEMGWFILNKYYELTDIVPAYTASILLDPRNRMEYINQNWPEEWRQPASERALSIWVEEYKELEPETNYGDPMHIDAPQHLDSPPSDKPKNLLAQYLEKNQAPRKAMNHGDDLFAVYGGRYY
jgi:hypothetical protein